ncbi:MAG: hypothetical protein L3J17_01975 [Candidatus Jettenia sp.]|nr:MAG: hypothetical protein L3J17_01975 [Candidatus Jettenia sp.]
MRLSVAHEKNGADFVGQGFSLAPRLNMRTGDGNPKGLPYRKAEATGLVDIRTQSMAREITVRPDGKAHSVIYFDAGGNEQEICASAIVVAGNAVETLRLLLLSKSGLFPECLANSSGLVGKYFTEHLALFCDGLFSERLDTWRGNPAGGIIQDFYETNKRNNLVRGWTISEF